MEPSGPLPPAIAAELEELTNQRDSGAISDIAYNVRRSILLDRREPSTRRATHAAGPPARELTPPPDGAAVPAYGWTDQPWQHGPVSGVAYGGFWIRAAAALIDDVILYIPLAIVFFLLLGFSIRAQSVSAISDLLIGWIVGFLVSALAYGVVFISTMGATPGMRALGLRVVRASDGGACTWGHAIARGLSWMVFGFLSRYLIGVLDPLWVAMDNRKQALHDKVAGTVVIRHWQGAQGLLSPDGQYRWDGSSWRPVASAR